MHPRGRATHAGVLALPVLLVALLLERPARPAGLCLCLAHSLTGALASQGSLHFRGLQGSSHEVHSGAATGTGTARAGAGLLFLLMAQGDLPGGSVQLLAHAGQAELWLGWASCQLAALCCQGSAGCSQGAQALLLARS